MQSLHLKNLLVQIPKKQMSKSCWIVIRINNSNPRYLMLQLLPLPVNRHLIRSVIQMKQQQQQWQQHLLQYQQLQALVRQLLWHCHRHQRLPLQHLLHNMRVNSHNGQTFQLHNICSNLNLSTTEWRQMLLQTQCTKDFDEYKSKTISYIQKNYSII